jgi:hypothetical protein
VTEAGHSAPWVLNPSPREAMLLFLTELRERHGSVESYVAKAGIDEARIAKLRDHLLEP